MKELERYIKRQAEIRHLGYSDLLREAAARLLCAADLYESSSLGRRHRSRRERKRARIMARRKNNHPDFFQQKQGDLR